jgi:DNA-directed RNA polymerase alpha subunit
MSSTQLDRFAAAALTGLVSHRAWEDAEELAAEAFRIARAMMSERNRQMEMPDSDVTLGDVLNRKVDKLELPLRITKKLAGIGITAVRDLTLTTEKAVRATGLGDESVREIKQALHRMGLALSPQ